MEGGDSRPHCRSRSLGGWKFDGVANDVAHPGLGSGGGETRSQTLVSRLRTGASHAVFSRWKVVGVRALEQQSPRLRSRRRDPLIRPSRACRPGVESRLFRRRPFAGVRRHGRYGPCLGCRGTVLADDSARPHPHSRVPHGGTYSSNRPAIGRTSDSTAQIGGPAGRSFYPARPARVGRTTRFGCGKSSCCRTT